MGLSNRHWQTPLTFEDFQFEEDRLVYIRGMRPQYIDGYALINAMEQLVVLCKGYKDVYDNVPEGLRIRIEHHVKHNHPARRYDPAVPYDFDSRDRDRYYPPISPDADPGGDSSGSE